MTGISIRLKDVVYKEVTDGTLRVLAEKSGIKQTSWANAFNGRQRPTSEMIEWVCHTWPQYAYWIVTGEKPAKHIEHTNVIRQKLQDGPDMSVLLTKNPKDWTDEEVVFLTICWGAGKLDAEAEKLMQAGFRARAS